jgi:hypothetical protein
MGATKKWKPVKPLHNRKRNSINDATPAEWDAVRDSVDVKTDAGKVYSNKGSKGYFPSKPINEHRKEFYESVMESRDSDVVNSPAHYNNGSVECIEYIKQQLSADEFKGYLLGNMIKYTHRHKYKNGLEDLKKAQWYQNKYIEEYGG